MRAVTPHLHPWPQEHLIYAGAIKGVHLLVKNFHQIRVHVLCPMLCSPLKGKICFHSCLHGNSNSVVVAMLQAGWAWFRCGNLHFLIAECQDPIAQPGLLWLAGQHQWRSCGSDLTPSNISASLLLRNAWERGGAGNAFNSCRHNSRQHLWQCWCGS